MIRPPPPRRWAYVYLTTYLRVRERTELTGTESYLTDLIGRGDTTWFPAQRAMCLRTEADDGDDSGATRGDVAGLEADVDVLRGALGDELARVGEAVRALGARAGEVEARVAEAVTALEGAVGAPRGHGNGNDGDGGAPAGGDVDT